MDDYTYCLFGFNLLFSFVHFPIDMQLLQFLEMLVA